MAAIFAMVVPGWGQRELTDPGFVNSVKLDEKQLRVHLSILSSDGFEGRETGEVGQRKAASYLEAYYGSLGFEPCNNGSFFQMVPLVNTQIKGGSMMVGKDTLVLVEDFWCTLVWM